MMCADAVNDEDEGQVWGGFGSVNRSNSTDPIQSVHDFDRPNGPDNLVDNKGGNRIGSNSSRLLRKSPNEPSSLSGCMFLFRGCTALPRDIATEFGIATEYTALPGYSHGI